MKKTIPCWENYQATDTGKIYSIKNKKYLKPQITNWGYETVTLYNEGKRKSVLKVHRLVMAAFKGTSDLEVNHIDGDKKNNKLSNLEYVEHTGNKITLMEVEHIKKLYATGLLNCYQIGKIYDVGHSCIYKIVKNKRWVI